MLLDHAGHWLRMSDFGIQIPWVVKGKLHAFLKGIFEKKSELGYLFCFKWDYGKLLFSTDMTIGVFLMPFCRDQRQGTADFSVAVRNVSSFIII